MRFDANNAFRQDLTSRGCNVTARRIAASTSVGILLAIGLLAVVQHYFIRMTGFDVGDEYVTLQMAQYAELPTVEFLHLVPAFLLFAIAPLQFTGAIRRRVPAVHRFLGRTYVALGIFVGTSGVALGILMPFGGTVESLIVTPLGIYFLFALVTAFGHARARRITEHRTWMIRALASALAIAAQRIFTGLLTVMIPGSSPQGNFVLAIVLAIVVCVAGAEIYLRKEPVYRAA